MDGLDDFLKRDEPTAEATETPVEQEAITEATERPTAEEPKGPERDEKGRFKPKGEEESASPAPTEEATEYDGKATIGERRRRQEAEARAAALETQLADLHAKLNPPQPAPSIWEDEQGWQQHFGSEVVGTAVQQATLNARLDMSEMMVRQAQPDFEDKKSAFLEMMKETPGLQQKAMADPHPWNFAYQYVTNYQRMQELAATNVSDLEAKLREKIEAEVRAELEAKKPQAPTPAIPDTLADAQSARGSSAAFTVPTLDEILRR